MSARPQTIPFEAQPDPQARRDCGAACLRMVYGSFGKDIPQAEIWEAIAAPNRAGTISSTTYRMTKDALTRGFSAIAFQARHPLQALRLCRDGGARVILNQRPTAESSDGHYSVMVDIGEEEIVLHDPFFGPSRRVPAADLLELWRPAPVNSEIAGFVLIAIAAEVPTPGPCWLCHATVPSAAICPRCKQAVPLQPSAALGCINPGCVARMWNYICCPFCDCGFTFGAESATAESLASAPAAAVQPTAPDFTRMFAGIDKFVSQVLTIPGAAEHPRIKQQLELLAESKGKLKTAAAEAAEHRKAFQMQLAAAAETQKQNQEAHQKKVEELNTPFGPLDGDSLGRALMKNLGFIR
jgi:hypothetical protein